MDGSVSGTRMKNPTHPGGFIWSEVIGPMGISVGSAAAILGVSEDKLAALFGERAPLTSGMAWQIEKAFGVSKDTLTRMQRSYEIYKDRGHPVP